MILTRWQEAAQQVLFEALLRRDSAAALAQIAAAHGRPLHVVGDTGCTSLHWAAVAGCDGVLAAIVGAGLSVDSLLGPLSDPTSQPKWFYELKVLSLTSNQRAMLLAPGMTALAMACRLGHLVSVQRLLELGADPNLAVQGAEGPGAKPYTPLSAAVLTPGTTAPGDTRRIVELLLQHGAEPLAYSVRLRCCTLRCACGSEFLPNGSLPLLVDHLERQHSAGRLVFGSGDVAAEVMVAAARCCRVQLFRMAHEFVLGASGLRWQEEKAAVAAAARLRATSRSRALSTSSTDSQQQRQEQEQGSRTSSDTAARGAGVGAAGVGGRGGSDSDSDSGPDVVPLCRPIWQPSAMQLFEALRGAALGGSPSILRCILASRLPFSVAQTDAAGNGLMAHSAAHSGCAVAVRLLHQAGAQLTLRRLLYVLEKTASPVAVAALLACQQPVVPPDTATMKALGVVSFSCPIHRLLHIWKRGACPAASADPVAWPRGVMRVLEELLAAGYRPCVFRGLRQPMVIAQGDIMSPATDPFDPFDYFPEAGHADSRLKLVAQQGCWDTTTHRVWPEAFKAAIRTFLLATHRREGGFSSNVGDSSTRDRRAERVARRGGKATWGHAAPGCCPAPLPPELLLQVATRAAWPMSAWI